LSRIDHLFCPYALADQPAPAPRIPPGAGAGEVWQTADVEALIGGHYEPPLVEGGQGNNGRNAPSCALIGCGAILGLLLILAIAARSIVMH
jgi:hypothetical protein